MLRKICAGTRENNVCCPQLRSPPANNGLHPTRDTLPVIKRNLAGGRVMRGVRRRHGERARGSAEPGWRKTYSASCGLTNKVSAATVGCRQPPGEAARQFPDSYKAK